jgi:hypothetical protein
MVNGGDMRLLFAISAILKKMKKVKIKGRRFSWLFIKGESSDGSCGTCLGRLHDLRRYSKILTCPSVCSDHR